MTNPAGTVRQSHYRWVVLGLSWAAFAAASVDRAAWGPSSQSVGTDFGVTLTQIGVFATAYYIGNVLSTVLGGFIADWIGSDRGRC